MQGDAPAPFMTFEAGNFPPELMREVRLLLDKKRVCSHSSDGRIGERDWEEQFLCIHLSEKVCPAQSAR